MKTKTQESPFRAVLPHRPAEPQRQLDSTDLLGARGQVDILHQDEIYRLRRTRQGKLILTK